MHKDFTEIARKAAEEGDGTFNCQTVALQAHRGMTLPSESDFEEIQQRRKLWKETFSAVKKWLAREHKAGRLVQVRPAKFVPVFGMEPAEYKFKE